MFTAFATNGALPGTNQYTKYRNSSRCLLHWRASYLSDDPPNPPNPILSQSTPGWPPGAWTESYRITKIVPRVYTGMRLKLSKWLESVSAASVYATNAM